MSPSAAKRTHCGAKRNQIDNFRVNTIRSTRSKKLNGLNH